MSRKIDNSSVTMLIREKLKKSEKPLIVSHIRPDGDAIGSVIGLGLTLRDAGKVPQMVLEDGLPAKYRFLEGSVDVSTSTDGEYDLVIALDCADQERLGKNFSDIAVDINIDHHITNNRFAEINLVRPETAATAAILADILPEMGFLFDKETANALLMGILTDTIGFRTTNVSPAVLHLSARLMEAGADLSRIYYQELVRQSFFAAKLWGMALSRLAWNENILWTSITLEDRQNADYAGRDDADLTNLLSAIEGSVISVLFNEQKGGKVKISWRSDSEVDVSKIAQQFGGGGHPPAAGAELNGSLEQVQEIVLDHTRQYLNNLYSKGEIKNG